MRVGRDLPVSALWQGIAYGDKKFVTVAKGSTYSAYMEDGKEWVLTTLPASRRWQGVAYGDGQFIAVAKYTNKAAMSEDGKTWVEIELGEEAAWNDICYGDGKFVVIAGGSRDNSDKLNYYDGEEWHSVTLPWEDRWYKVCYGGGVYVILGHNSTMYSSDLEHWSAGKRKTSGEWKSVCYANDKFTAILANTSTVAYSSDGIEWKETSIISSQSWYTIAYGNDRYMALAYKAYGYSSDGLKWEVKELDEYGYWYSVIYGDGCFCAISNGSNNVLYSFDGVHVNYFAQGDMTLNEKLKLAGAETVEVVDNLTSTSTTSALSANQGRVLNEKIEAIPMTEVEDSLTSTSTTSALSANQGRVLNEKIDALGPSSLEWTTFGLPLWGVDVQSTDMIYGTKKFLATPHSSPHYLFKSVDGEHWQPLGINAKPIVFCKDRFLCQASTASTLQYILEDEDTVSTQTTGLANNSSINYGCYANGKFILVGANGLIMTSEDWETWQIIDTGLSTVFNLISYGNGKFVAIGSDRTVLTSEDGETWTQQTNFPSTTIQALCFAAGLFVAVAGYNIYTSEDGSTWTYRHAFDSQPECMFYTGNKFITAAKKTVYTSVDGITWTAARTFSFNSGSITLGYGAGKIIAYNSYDGYCYYVSDDGTTWTDLSLGVNLTMLRYINGQFIAAGNMSNMLYIYYSSDGITWTTIRHNSNKVFNDMCYGDMQYVACGNGIYTQTSIAQNVWTPVTSGGTWYGVCYGNGLYVAVGAGGTISTSPDGTTWTSQTSGISTDLRAVCYGANKFVALAETGTVITSTDGETWTTQVTQTGSGMRCLQYIDKTFSKSHYMAGSNFSLSTDGEHWKGIYTSAAKLTRGNGAYAWTCSEAKGIGICKGGLVPTSNGAAYQLSDAEYSYHCMLADDVAIGNNKVVARFKRSIVSRTLYRSTDEAITKMLDKVYS